MPTTNYTVEGMTCGHCVATVTTEISALPGVTEVGVALDTGVVSVTSEEALDRAALQNTLEEAGYVLND